MRAVLFSVVVASLALTLATVTSQAVFDRVSALAGAAGFSTVAARNAAERQAQIEAVQRTAERITERTMRAAGRNAASAAAEAMPGAGAAVIAMALALEARDACDTARDMAVLTGLVAEPQADPKALAAEVDCAHLLPKGIEPASIGAIRAAAPGFWAKARGLFNEK